MLALPHLAKSSQLCPHHGKSRFGARTQLLCWVVDNVAIDANCAWSDKIEWLNILSTSLEPFIDITYVSQETSKI